MLLEDPSLHWDLRSHLQEEQQGDQGAISPTTVDEVGLVDREESLQTAAATMFSVSATM